MKKMLCDYFFNLNYTIEQETSGSIRFVHNDSKQVVILDLSFYHAANVPDLQVTGEELQIFIIDEKVVENWDMEVFEKLVIGLPANAAVIPYSNESMEHMMKDIWFFISKN